MATTAKIVKDKKTPKFACGTATAAASAAGRARYLRKFALCRLCFRELALRGEVAGVIKSSW